jgi:hypothetical protein
MSDSIRHLHRGIVRVRQGGTGRGCRYPADLRAAVADHVRSRRDRGEPWAAIGRELCLPVVTLQRWLDGGSEGFRPVVVGPAEGRVDGATPVVILPNGIRVEGLEVPELVALLRALA